MGHASRPVGHRVEPRDTWLRFLCDFWDGPGLEEVVVLEPPPEQQLLLWSQDHPEEQVGVGEEGLDLGRQQDLLLDQYQSPSDVGQDLPELVDPTIRKIIRCNHERWLLTEPSL